MLAADKLQLQSALKQQATALKEKEFQLHHSNLMTVGTQAAVLAGLDITMFIEFNPPANSEWHPDHQNLAAFLKLVYYAVIVAAFCANMLVVSHTTALSVLGAGMALRGPDGSMMTATDGLYEERRSVFYAFGVGLACTLGSVLVSVWLLLPWYAALVCWVVTLHTSRMIYTNYRRVCMRFGFDESETVDFRDIMEGPAVATLSRLFQRGGGGHQRPPRSGPPALIGKKGKFYRKSTSAGLVEDFHHEEDLELQESLVSHDSMSSNDVKHRRKPKDAAPSIQTV